MEGTPCYVIRADGVKHAFARLSVVPRVGDYVVTRDERRWLVRSVTHFWAGDGVQDVKLVCDEAP